MSRAQKILYLFFGLALLTIYLVLSLTILSQDNQEKIPATTPRVPAPTATPTPTPPPAISLQDVVTNSKTKNQISANDRKIRNALIATLPNRSGNLETTTFVRLAYVKSADVFHAESLTRDIAQARIETIEWFLGKGLSKAGICRLPVIFYFDPKRVSSETTGLDFYPLLSDCH